MKYFKLLVFLGLAGLIVGCSKSATPFNIDVKLGEFGAFYTKLNSGQVFEKYSRTGDYADIVVDLGRDSAMFVFWRGSSFLPFLQTPNGKWYVDELVERDGDGTDRMPDRTNAYSVIKLIESSDDQVVVQWRYLPKFTGGNPQLGVSADKFVDEIFYIKPDGSVKRTCKIATKKIDDWRDPKNIMVQTLQLSANGIEVTGFQEASKSKTKEKIEGNPVIPETVGNPVAWWKFNEGVGDNTVESVSNTSLEVAGNKTLWRKGVSGTALQFDGYFSRIFMPAAKAPKLVGALTLEGWVALGAYPWSYVPIVQQSSDGEEVVLAKTGNEAFLTGEDEREEMDEPDDSFDFVLKEEDDTGYFMGLDGYGKPTFKLRVGGKWEQLVADKVLERRNWYHLAATYDKESGKMKIFLDGKIIAQKEVAKADIELAADADVKIGKGKDRRPIRPVRQNTFADSYSLDGLVDEIRIYDVALTEGQVAQSYKNYMSNKKIFAVVDMDKRVLPDGEDRKEFGAYYTHLKFYNVWDNLWRFSDHPDVVVEFDENPSKFIYWRGVGYIPMMVNDKGQWYSNEFNETWNRTGGEGCQEPMSDKESYNNHARIIENTPARIVVQWRYPLIDVNHVMANFNDNTGWCDWSDWYYYIYPDGIAVKTMHLWTNGKRDHEWQESMAIFGPNQHPEQIIHTKNALSMLNLDGDEVDYDWITGPPDNVDKPDGECIQYINYTGNYKPVTIGDFTGTNVYGGEITEYAVFPTWNHWPVSQMPSDGRYAIYPDRTAHSSLTHLFLPIYREEKEGPTPYYEKILMEAMLDMKPKKLVPLAGSWMKPAKLTALEGAEGEYERGQRAYLLTKNADTISFTVSATKENPIHNLSFVVKGWDDDAGANVLVNGIETNIRQGTIRDIDGTRTLVLFIEKQSNRPLRIEINK